MIGYLEGKILDISENNVLLLTSTGIGYEVGITSAVYAEYSGKEHLGLYIYHHISEAAQSLFGFTSLEEKKLFSELIKISGVGGKVALQILSLGKSRLISAVQSDDKKTIESIKGIGKKMAEKIVLELKDKDFVKNAIPTHNENEKTSKQILLPLQVKENITSSLVAMGYPQRDIVAKLELMPEKYQTVEEILPYMIRELS